MAVLSGRPGPRYSRADGARGITVVAVEDGEVVGFAQMLTDGEIMPGYRIYPVYDRSNE